MKKMIVLIVCLMLCFSCSQEAENHEDEVGSVVEADIVTLSNESSSNLEDSIMVVAEELNQPELEPEPASVLEIPQRPSREVVISIPKQENLEVNMPEEYLETELIFSSLEAEELTAETYMLVGSNQAVLYKERTLETAVDLAALESIVPIPIGSIIPILELYKSPNEAKWDGYFFFEEEYNYFYLTEYNGQRGLVFGADLTSPQRNTQTLEQLSHYYTRDQFSDEFYDFNGIFDLSENLQSTLVENHLAFEYVDPNSYSLSGDYPDDLVALYKREAQSRETDLYITSDLFVHSLHLFFDNLLQTVEEETFFPLLGQVVDTYLSEIKLLQNQDSGEFPAYTEDLRLTENYFLIADALMAMAPETSVEGYSREKSYEDVDVEEVLQNYNEEVVKELRLIMANQGFGMSPNFHYREDYSQFKVRGHYTKNGILGSYFQTMMWFGRLHFVLSLSDYETSDEIVEVDGEFQEEEGESAAATSLFLTPITLIINKITQDNTDLYKAWDTLFSPITSLIGASDDLNFNDIMPLIDYVDWENFPEWVSQDENIWGFIEYSLPQLRAPMISGNSVDLAPSEDGKSPTAGFRLFGQRFVFDSYIFSELSWSVLHEGSRIPQGIDVFACMGSQEAASLALQESDPPDASIMNDLTNTIASFDEDFWNLTFYNQYLDTLRQMANFEQGAGFYFTDKPAWNLRALQSAHGAWAELRHDTILYVKQSYAERSGGGGIDASSRVIPYQRPIHYIEPNLSLFYSLQRTVAGLVENMSNYGLLSEIYRDKLYTFMDIINQSTAIVQLEVQDLPITEEQNNFITQIPFKLAQIIIPTNAGAASYSENPEEFRMPIIADVHTDSPSGQVVEVATGVPYRIHLALVDGQGGQRIATGYTYSYFEFLQPMSDRLTDEQWKDTVYSSDDYLIDYMPFWLQDYYSEM